MTNLKYYEELKLLSGNLNDIVMAPGIPVTVVLSGFPVGTIVRGASLSVRDGSTSSDYALEIFDKVSADNIRSLLQIEDADNLPTITVKADELTIFKHYVVFLEKSSHFGGSYYSARARSKEVMLDEIATVDMNTSTNSKLETMQQMLKKVMDESASDIIPVFAFEDKPVLHITRFYEMPFIDMLRDIISGFPIRMSFIDSPGSCAVYFVDTTHKPAEIHIAGRRTSRLTVSSSFIKPVDREW